MISAILAGLLLVVLPLLAMVQARMVPPGEVERMPAYVSSLILLGVLAGASLAVGLPSLGARGMGLLPIPPVAELVGWTLGLTAAGVVVLFIFRGVGVTLGLEEQELLRQILPRTPRERWVFAGLSLAAGVGEEFAYRGFLIPALMGWGMSPLAALLLSSGAFGVVHAYQGWVGFVRTGLMGGVLAWSFLVSGSLWPAVAAHALIDLLAGLVLAPWLGVEAEPPLPEEHRSTPTEQGSP